MRAQVRKIGNSLGSIIPAALIQQLHLKEGTEINVSAENGKIIIEPINAGKKRFPFSEKELLIGLDAHSVHSDELAILSSNEIGE